MSDAALQLIKDRASVLHATALARAAHELMSILSPRVSALHKR